MKKLEIYFQRQDGNNCRLHSLNGYFGKNEISQQRWDEYMREYDKVLKTRYFN